LKGALTILIITNLYPPHVIGGYERAIADFAQRLHQRGHRVVVLTTGSETAGSMPRHPSDLTVVRSLRLCGQWLDNEGPSLLPPDLIDQILEHNHNIVTHLLNRIQPQVCLAGNIDLLGVQVLEPLLGAAIPVAHYVMNRTPNYPVEEAPRVPFHRYITCSNWVTRSLQNLGYPAETAQTIYPGAAVEDFYQTELPSRDRLRIAYASLVMVYKGTDVLVEALCLLHAAGIPFEATIAGGTLSTAFVDTLKRYIADEGLQEVVHFTGALSRQELIQLYKTHNVLVFPSRFEEPFGISQIEAMAAGLTLVTSGTGGAAEIVKHGETGFLFESENPFDLADILSSLPTDPAIWEQIARQGQRHACAQFSQTQATEQLEALLMDMALPHGNGAELRPL